MASDPILMDFSSGLLKVTSLRSQEMPQLAENTAAASEKPVPSRMLNLYPHYELTKTVLDSLSPQLLTTLHTREHSFGTLISETMQKLANIRPANSKEAEVLKGVQDEITKMSENRELCNAYRRAALAG